MKTKELEEDIDFESLDSNNTDRRAIYDATLATQAKRNKARIESGENLVTDEHDEKMSLLEAHFRRTNATGALLTNLSSSNIAGTKFNVAQQLKNDIRHRNLRAADIHFFDGVKTLEKYDKIKYDLQAKYRIEEAGFWSNAFCGVVAGILDPINLLGIGLVGKAFTGAKAFFAMPAVQKGISFIVNHPKISSKIASNVANASEQALNYGAKLDSLVADTGEVVSKLMPKEVASKIQKVSNAAAKAGAALESTSPMMRGVPEAIKQSMIFLTPNIAIRYGNIKDLSIEDSISELVTAGIVGGGFRFARNYLDSKMIGSIGSELKNLMTKEKLSEYKVYIKKGKEIFLEAANGKNEKVNKTVSEYLIKSCPSLRLLTSNNKLSRKMGMNLFRRNGIQIEEVEAGSIYNISVEEGLNIMEIDLLEYQRKINDIYKEFTELRSSNTKEGFNQLVFQYLENSRPTNKNKYKEFTSKRKSYKYFKADTGAQFNEKEFKLIEQAVALTREIEDKYLQRAIKYRVFETAEQDQAKLEIVEKLSELPVELLDLRRFKSRAETQELRDNIQKLLGVTGEDEKAIKKALFKHIGFKRIMQEGRERKAAKTFKIVWEKANEQERQALKKDARYKNFKDYIEESVLQRKNRKTKDIQHGKIMSRPVLTKQLFDNFSADQIRELALQPKFLEQASRVRSFGYTHSIFDPKKVLANEEYARDVFKKMTALNYPKLKPKEVEASVNYLMNNLLDEGSMAKSYMRSLQEMQESIQASLAAQGVSRFSLTPKNLRHLAINVENELLWPLLKDDVVELVNSEIRSLARVTELNRIAIENKHSNFHEYLQNYMEQLWSNAKTETERLGAKREIEAVLGSLNILFKTDATFTNPTLNKVVSAFKSWNVSRMLGGILISALPDVANVVGKYGVIRTLRAFKATFKPELKENVAGIGKIVSASEAAMLSDKRFLDQFTTYSERAKNWSRIVMKYSGMDWWNDHWKKTVGLLHYSDILEACSSQSESSLKFLRYNGLSEQDAKAIQQLYEKFGSVFTFEHEKIDFKTLSAGIKTLPLESIENVELRDKIWASLQSAADTTIVTPGLGDVPLFIRNKTFSLIFQFRSFMFSSFANIMVPLLKSPQAMPFRTEFFASKIGLAIFAQTLKFGAIYLTTKKAFDLASWSWDIIKYSDLLGPVYDGVDVLQRWFHDPATALRQESTAYAGLHDATKVVKSLFLGGSMNESDLLRIKRMLPFNNLIGLDQISRMFIHQVSYLKAPKKHKTNNHHERIMHDIDAMFKDAK